VNNASIPPAVSPRRKTLKRWLKAVEAVLLLSIFAYILHTLWNNLEQLQSREFTLRIWTLMVSFPFAIAYLVGRAWIWHLMVRRLIGRFPLHVDMLSWMSSLVGKYIPGKVFLLLGRVHFYRGRCPSVMGVSIAFLIEACCSCLAASLIFGIAILGYRQRDGLGLYSVTVGSAVAVLIVLTHPAVLGALLNLGMRISRRPPVELRLRWADVLTWTVMMAANWLVLGTGFYLMLYSIYAIPAALLLYVTGAFALAGVIGVLVLFAPSGIGVREGVMLVALTKVLPEAVAAIGTLAARVWMTLAEVLCAGLAILIVKRMPIENNESNASDEESHSTNA